jgi:hypothetical protein
MKLWLANLTIVAYLATLSWGVTSHALKVGANAHPVMYYLIWDMFCGWSSYELRFHIVGESVSGKYYELDPPPWGEFKPFGKIGRRHYDVTGTHAGKFARNTLRHTDHEPIARIFVVEEYWAKKYNLPESIWSRRFEEPKDRKSYYNVRYVLNPDGTPRQAYPNWIAQQYAHCLSNNPRLHADSRRNQPVMTYQLPRGYAGNDESMRYFDSSMAVPTAVPSPHGN